MSFEKYNAFVVLGSVENHLELMAAEHAYIIDLNFRSVFLYIMAMALNSSVLNPTPVESAR